MQEKQKSNFDSKEAMMGRSGRSRTVRPYKWKDHKIRPQMALDQQYQEIGSKTAVSHVTSSGGQNNLIYLIAIIFYPMIFFIIYQFAKYLFRRTFRRSSRRSSRRSNPH